ncbi:hypothetical protein CYY_010305 [Polysphondylium violaceum]|uniref:FNIP repeat-containing protein n=1 Tax=Polysphondylium violaceum TaxID=133409 RepID=A0A8J4UTY5_9MYCE|nr:hypothetical protein CYY_010305 [Polysphondylium violaceum]
MNNNQLFFSIFRNISLKRIICSLIVKDITIDAHPDYLDDNHQYLQNLICGQEYKLQINASITNESIQQFKLCKHRDLYTSINFSSSLPKEIHFDIVANYLPKYIQIISNINEHVLHQKQLRDIPTLTNLSCHPLVDKLKPNTLPINLEFFTVSLNNGSIEKDVLPQNMKSISIRDQCHKNKDTYLNSVFPHKMDAHLGVIVDYDNPLEYHRTNVNITSVYIEYLRYEPLSANLFPPTVKKICLMNFSSSELQIGCIPQCATNLLIGTLGGELRIGVLSTHKFLTSLDIMTYNGPLLPGVFPKSLTTLCLSSYDIQLQPKVIPQSIKELYLTSYSHNFDNNVLPMHSTVFDELCLYGSPILKKGSLPNCIKTLRIRADNVQSSDIYPASLNKLCLVDCNKENLKIVLKSLPHSIVCLEINFDDTAINHLPPLPLSITNLKLNCFNEFKIDSLEFLPPKLQKLTLNLNFNSSIFIPPKTLPLSLEVIMITSQKNIQFKPPPTVRTYINNRYYQKIN